jgi:hypothetical protein
MTVDEALDVDCPCPGCPGWPRVSGWCEDCAAISREVLVAEVKRLREEYWLVEESRTSIK